jgi:hypothetical protein
MVGLGERDMTCAEVVRESVSPIARRCSGRKSLGPLRVGIAVLLAHDAHTAFHSCISGFRVVACSWLPSRLLHDEVEAFLARRPEVRYPPGWSFYSFTANLLDDCMTER